LIGRAARRPPVPKWQTVTPTVRLQVVACGKPSSVQCKLVRVAVACPRLEACRVGVRHGVVQPRLPRAGDALVFNTRCPAWLPAAPLEYTPPPSWGGGKVDVQVTPVLGTDWKGLYANAHCAALASEETNHTRKNGVCVSSSPPGGGSSRMLPACTMGCAFMSPVPPARVPPMCPAPPSCLVSRAALGGGHAAVLLVTPLCSL
jgi:hypothetical protein